MAKKEETKIVLERMYTVPLRREYLKVPRYKRTQKASKALRLFLEKHMKSENVLIGKYLNAFLWKHGIRNPPHHVKVTATKDDKGVVRAELVGAPKEEKKEKTEKMATKKETKQESQKEENKTDKKIIKKELKVEPKVDKEQKEEVPKTVMETIVEKQETPIVKTKKKAPLEESK